MTESVPKTLGPTGRLRWVTRSTKDSFGAIMGCFKALQQEFEVEVYHDGELHHRVTEWHDVPDVYDEPKD